MDHTESSSSEIERDDWRIYERRLWTRLRHNLATRSWRPHNLKDQSRQAQIRFTMSPLLGMGPGWQPRSGRPGIPVSCLQGSTAS